MFTYPHTIDNGHGERLTFLRRVSTPGGEALEVENCVQPGAGPPMHVHYHQEESLTVVQGRVGYQRPGEEPRYAEAGETVTFGPGEPHRFWNAGEDELKCTGYIRPPDSIEYFLGELYASQKRGAGGRPDPFDAAYLAWRYRDEFGMAAIPAFVRRFVFPVQVALGTLLGKYRKYADAPPPVQGTRP
jgi:quercetin dioxygenase-like cupin family protein